MEGESYMQQSPSKNDEFEKALEKFKQGVQARNRAGYEELQNADIAIAAAVSSFPSLYNSELLLLRLYC